jgi:hypothetical protein
MSGSCPIVTIKTANGPVDINESDFDPAVHELVEPTTPSNADSNSNLSNTTEAPDFVAMDRDALIAYLEKAGVKVWPTTGEEKLREKCVEHFASISKE